MHGSARIEVGFIQRTDGTLRFLRAPLMRASGAFTVQQAAEADGRAAQSDRSAVVLTLPRGRSPMVNSVPAAARRQAIGRLIAK
jgi:hypothetical protein